MFQQIETLVPSPHFYYYYFLSRGEIKEGLKAKLGWEGEGSAELLPPTECRFRVQEREGRLLARGAIAE